MEWLEPGPVFGQWGGRHRAKRVLLSASHCGIPDVICKKGGTKRP